MDDMASRQGFDPPALGPPAPRGWLGWSLAAAVAAPLLVFAASARITWDATWRAAEVEVARTADAAAEYARRILEIQVMRIEQANDILAGHSDAEIRAREAEFHRLLRDIAAERQPRETQAFYLFVYDRDGFPLVGGSVLPVAHGRQALDREFNQVLRDPAAGPYHVSPLYTGRDTGRAFFAITGRRTRTGNGVPPGSYDGIINASVYIDTVVPSLRALAVLPSDAVALVRSDGALLARSPGFGNLAENPRLAANSPMLPVMARGEERGQTRAVSSVDGIERVAAFRHVGGDWPVYASVARDRSAVMAAWREAVLPKALLGLGSSLLLLTLSVAVLRRQRALQEGARQRHLALAAANATLERRVRERTRDLQERERVLRLAQQAAGAASWAWEPESGRVIWPDEMYRMLGLDPAADTQFATLEGLLAFVHPDDHERLRAAVDGALRTGAMEVEFRILRRVPDGRRELRWLLCRAGYFPAEDGQAARLVGIDIDITDRRHVEERFEVATAAMEGFVYEWDIPSGRVQRTAGLAKVLGESMPEGVEAWTARIHPDDRGQALEACRAALEDPTKDRFATEYRVRRADGGWAWIWDRGRITRDPATGAAVRVVGGSVDITARRVAEERQLLLLRELDHRGKNSLAVVKAALRLAPRRDPEVFAALEGRVDALARAQTMLSETGWSGTDLGEVLQASLAPFDGGSAALRVELAGPALRLAPTATQPIAMAVHELATNAMKYGALSAPGGRLRLDWRVEGDALRLSWAETGGPKLAGPPARRGFGSRVVDMTIRNQLGGTVGWSWEEDGLRVELAIPLKRAAAAEGG